MKQMNNNESQVFYHQSFRFKFESELDRWIWVTSFTVGSTQELPHMNRIRFEWSLEIDELKRKSRIR